MIEDQRSTKKLSRVVYIAIASVVLVLAINFVPNSSLSSAQAYKAHVASVIMASRPGNIANNTVPNPAPTNGPTCHHRVIILVDRSYSIVNDTPNNDLRDAKYLKNSVNGALMVLASQAHTSNSKMEVIIQAFAGKTVTQNDPYTGDLGAWAQANDVAHYDATKSNPYDSLNAMMRNVVGMDPNGQDGIWFRNEASWWPAFRTYPGDPNATALSWSKGYPSDDNGTTNYEGAFNSARGLINFWTPGPASDADDDFDLVLMVTDGLPTTNDGPGGMGGQYVTPDNQDLSRAQGAINALRLGAFGTIPPTPVVGVLAGQAAAGSSSDGYMNQTFGAGNWTKNTDFSSLQGTILNALAPYSCVKAKIPVATGIKVAAPVSNGDILEGSKQRATVDLNIENSGDIALSYVRARYRVVGAPWPNSWTTVVAFGNMIQPHTSISVPLVSLGAPMGTMGGTKNYEVQVTSASLFDDATMVLAPGSTKTPSAQSGFQYNVIPVPLPS